MEQVHRFLPKKRRDLMAIIERTRGGIEQPLCSGSSTSVPSRSVHTSDTILRPSDLSTEFQTALDELADQRIFQWSTFYRDCLEKHLNRLWETLKAGPMNGEDLPIHDPLSAHTTEIFSRGYCYATERGHSQNDAIQKSIRGLSRFLGLPLDYYSARWSSASGRESGIALREVVSATFSAILHGYEQATFGTTRGDEVLEQTPRSWLHFLAFMTPQHAERILARLPTGPRNRAVTASVLPLLEALQVFFERRTDDYIPTPVASHYYSHHNRLDVSLRPPPDARLQRAIEVRLFLATKTVPFGRLTAEIRDQVALVIAPLGPSERKAMQQRPDLQEIVVPRRPARAPVAEGAFAALERAILSLRQDPIRASPLTYNFAKEFPLHNPGRVANCHVPRTSVRDLLRTFERRNGVRLWCSVRRSGKTTACFDLESTTGEALIISQTCGSSEVQDDKRFYSRVAEAIGSSGLLPESFLRDVIAECVPVDLEDKRVVLVIDEYETLFGYLQSEAERMPHVRYTVVQPILNQLREFASDNLLVFLGQQPSAYFILMDQNQLAPYVEQDPFPLFEHPLGTTTGEFAELVNQVLRGHIDCKVEFLDSLYEETAGHPYLTVNVLVEFVQWLIDSKRSQRSLRVSGRDFRDFTEKRLSAERIRLSSTYEFFRNTAAAALSQRGYTSNPWLFTSYWTIRLLAEAGQEELRIGREDFEGLMQRIPVPSGVGIPDAAEVLRTSTLANFLAYDERWVAVKVRTLGRIVAATQPALA